MNTLSLTFHDLPFEPEEMQVIYVESHYDEHINKLIQEHYHQIRALFKKRGFNTEKLKQFRFPVFKGEKFIGENYIWCQLGEKYNVYAVNQIIYLCDYLEGGLTKSGRTLRIKCPYGGMENSKVLLKKGYPLKYRIKNGILYDCYGFFSNEKVSQTIKKSGQTALTIGTLIPGYLLFAYWRYKYGR